MRRLYFSPIGWNGTGTEHHKGMQADEKQAPQDTSEHIGFAERGSNEVAQGSGLRFSLASQPLEINRPPIHCQRAFLHRLGQRGMGVA